MKLRRVKGALCGALVAGIVLSTSPVAFAKAANYNIPVTYNNIKIVVDGKQLTTSAEPFIYEGVTYLPVRAVAEAVGKEVYWDGNTNTVTLGKASTTTDTYSRTNPAPVGVPQTITIDNYFDDYTAEVKVNKVFSGDERNQLMGSTVANDKIEEGYDFVIAEVEVSILSSKNTEKSINISSSDFTTFTSNNESLDDPYIYLEDGYLDSTLYVGGTAKGYIICKTKIGDTGTKIVFGQEYDGTGGIWFSLK